MRTRNKGYGKVNIVGARIEKLRKERKISQKDFITKLQLAGLDINPTSYSKLEGQIRIATDIEIYTIAKVLNVTTDYLFEE